MQNLYNIVQHFTFFKIHYENNYYLTFVSLLTI